MAVITGGTAGHVIGTFNLAGSGAVMTAIAGLGDHNGIIVVKPGRRGPGIGGMATITGVAAGNVRGIFNLAGCRAVMTAIAGFGEHD